MKFLVVLVIYLSMVHALDNGLARTPPMGWLSWERFRCNVDCKNDPDNCIGEKLFMAMADHIVADGYKNVGYEYVNIDDCWASKERDAQSRLQPDPARFPSGMKALADYVHSKGLKLGIYGDFGSHTCGGYPGSEFYMSIDAQTFADWGIDLLKFDGCYSDPADMPVGYPLMGHFLNKTGRPILYSCSWPAYITLGSKKHETADKHLSVKSIPPYADIAKACNIWRNYGDIQDSWSSVVNIIQFYGKDQGNFSVYAGPGNFNDPDMLIIGDFSLSLEQQKSQMAMWAMMASPLFMSNDLRSIPPESKAILQNQHVIKINQDPMGIQGRQILMDGSLDIWVRPIMPKGKVALAVLNRGTGGTPTKLELSVKYLGSNVNGYNITEVFDQKPLGVFKLTDNIPLQINPSGTLLATAVPL